MIEAPNLVILLDVDNTLLDNDRFIADLDARLRASFGRVGCEQYWDHYGQLRDSLGYADYLGALQLFRAEHEGEADLLTMSDFMLEYAFAEHLFPRALETIEYLARFGLPVVLSDGDMVFQPRKIRRSGIWDAVDARVQIHRHKERTLAAVVERYPARHYLMVDDKVKLLTTMKRVMGHRLTTIYVEQGHYAAEAEGHAFDPAPDLKVSHLAQLIGLDIGALCADPSLQGAAGPSTAAATPPL